MKECCSVNPCKLDQGDCDSHDECAGDLVCGRDNCGPEFLFTADCCTTQKGNLLNNKFARKTIIKR